MRTKHPRQYRDTEVDVKLVLSALWITMLFVFAYVDIFGFYRADVLEAALDGEVATTSFEVTQGFLVFALIYILAPTSMVALSLLLRPRVSRIANIVVSALYATSILALVVTEEWTYYVIGSVVEVGLLLAIARIAWTWPPPEPAPVPAVRETEPASLWAG